MSTIARLTLAQYDRMIESGVFEIGKRQRIELIEGELREMTPIGPEHEEAVTYLMTWSIKALSEAQARVRIQHSVGLPELDSVPEPDVAWARPRSYRKGRTQPKDILLIIEVAATSLAYDRGEKAALYAAAGIRDYWIVNIADACVEVFRQPQRGNYLELTTYSPGQELSPLEFPEIKLVVAELFA